MAGPIPTATLAAVVFALLPAARMPVAAMVTIAARFELRATLAIRNGQALYLPIVVWPLGAVLDWQTGVQR